jgi:hypothetical protein
MSAPEPSARDEGVEGEATVGGVPFSGSASG